MTKSRKETVLMKAMLKRFWQEEEGFGTIELVLLIGVLIAIALLFKDRVTKFVTDLMDKIFQV